MLELGLYMIACLFQSNTCYFRPAGRACTKRFAEQFTVIGPKVVSFAIPIRQ